MGRCKFKEPSSTLSDGIFPHIQQQPTAATPIWAHQNFVSCLRGKTTLDALEFEFRHFRHFTSPSTFQIVKMLIVLMVIFGVCWLPYHAYFLALYYIPTLGQTAGIQGRRKPSLSLERII